VNSISRSSDDEVQCLLCVCVCVCVCSEMKSVDVGRNSVSENGPGRLWSDVGQISPYTGLFKDVQTLKVTESDARISLMPLKTSMH